jgi:hypothetical protein
VALSAHAEPRDYETEASILLPYFEAVQDTFVESMEKSDRLVRRGTSRARKSKLLLSDAAHDTHRHFAMTNTTTLAIVCAPEMADLPEPTIVGILAHEFGHVLDFGYPGSFSWPRFGAGRAYWVGESPRDKAEAWRKVYGKDGAKSRNEYDDVLPCANWMRVWEDRSDDEIEWAADAICYLITGKRIGYSGPCLLQEIERGKRRPKGLR